MVTTVQAAAEEASLLLRRRLCDPVFIHSFKSSPNRNYSKLKFIISNSITEARNNSVLLLGPRGSGKAAVLELVLSDLKVEYPDMISMVRLNGLLHGDDNYGLKEIARQLCLEHNLTFSKMGKQRVLYSLLDALQSLTSQAVVVGLSCRLDADQLLEKRVRSRFSHRKLLFLPPSTEDTQKLLENLLYLPKETNLSRSYVLEFNLSLQVILDNREFKDVLRLVSDVDSNISYLVMFLYHAVCSMDLEHGYLSLENFKTSASSLQRQPKHAFLRKYNAIMEAYRTSDCRSRSVCLRAFEHLLGRGLIIFADGNTRFQSRVSAS